MEGANYCCLYLSRCFLIIVAGISILYNGHHPQIAFDQPPCGVHPSESSGSNWPRPQYITRTPPYFAPRSSAHRMNHRNTNLRQTFFLRRQYNVFRKHCKIFMYFLSNLRTCCITLFADGVNLVTYCENLRTYSVIFCTNAEINRKVWKTRVFHWFNSISNHLPTVVAN